MRDRFYSRAAQDYRWNAEGNEGVIAVLTANVPVVHISGGTVNQIETAAWGERFGRNILDFKAPVKNPDKRFKKWFQCTHCYAHWVLGTADGGRAASAGPEDGEATSHPHPHISRARAPGLGPGPYAPAPGPGRGIWG